MMKIKKRVLRRVKMKNNIGLQGEKINKIFQQARQIGDLHGVITSPTGNYFRLGLLQSLRNGLTPTKLKAMRKIAKLGEHERHINKLIVSKLAKYDSNKNIYLRTERGKAALDAVMEF